MARNKILIAEAKRLNLAPTQQQQDSMANLARTQLKGVLQTTGLLGIKPQAGENESQAIDRKVEALLTAVVKGEQNVIPLGPLAFTLRDQYDGQVYDQSYPTVVAKVQATRPAAPPQGLQMPNPQGSGPAQAPAAGPAQAPAAPPAAKK